MKWILHDIPKCQDALGTLGRFLSMSRVLPGARVEPQGCALVLHLDRIRFEAPRESSLDGGARAWRYARARARVEIGPIDPGRSGPSIERADSLAGHLLFGIRVTMDGAVELRASDGIVRVAILPATRIVIEDLDGADREATEVYRFGPAPRSDLAREVEALASA